MKAQGINLAWIVVKDIEKAIKFYTEIVGLELKEYHKEFHWAELAGPDGSRLGIGQESPECPDMKAGINAVVTVTVDDIYQANQHFLDKGATLVGELVTIPEHVMMQTFVDTDGNTLQLVQKLD